MSSRESDELTRQMVALGVGASVSLSDGSSITLGLEKGRVTMLLRGPDGEDLCLLRCEPERVRTLTSVMVGLADRAESGRLN